MFHNVFSHPMFSNFVNPKSCHFPSFCPISIYENKFYIIISHLADVNIDSPLLMLLPAFSIIEIKYAIYFI